MRNALAIWLLVCLPIPAQQAPIPAATQLSGNSFFVKKSWNIGGVGNWDALTMDLSTQRLYIAHGRKVQVVDVESGSLVGEIPGFSEAHSIALDDGGTFGYVSDGPANAVDVINRQNLRIDAVIPIHCSPRSIAFEPRSKLVFAVCGANAIPAAPRTGAGPAQPAVTGVSHVIAIDTDKNKVLAEITVVGDFRFAQPDGDGHVYFTVGPAQHTFVSNGSTVRHSSPPRIARIDASGILEEVRQRLEARPAQSQPAPSQSAPSSTGAVHLDWSANQDPGSLLHFLPLNSDCGNPQGLAIDFQHQRLFAACDDQRFLVLDSNSGNVIASLTTGPGDDVLAYDQTRGLIFIANGAGYGSLTIVQQDPTTDSYAVIQNLPTMERARTLAVDPANGEVYLVTDLQGVDLTKTGGIGTLHSDPLPGSFKVLVVGH
jgi:DNA-binding beta-propeller fold protein YncE